MPSNERKIVESILKRSKLKEKDVEEIDSIIKRDLFEMDELAGQLEKDFKNIDIEATAGRVRSEVKEKIRKKHPSVFG